MKQVEFKELLKMAQGFYSSKTKWHFHLLTPSCTFNDSDKFSIILENDETQESWVTFFSYKPLKEGEKLENMFYGRV